MRKLLNISIMVVLIYTGIVLGEFIPQKAFVNFTIENGIPYGSIEEVHMDRYRNIWFLGSNNQIYYFNGRNYYQLPLAFVDSVNGINSMLVLDDEIFLSTEKKIFRITDIYSGQPTEDQLDFLPAGEYTRLVCSGHTFYAVNIDSGLIVCFDRQRLFYKERCSSPLRYLLVNDSILAVSTDDRKIILFRRMTDGLSPMKTISLDFLQKNYYIEPLVIVGDTMFALVNEYGIIAVLNFPGEKTEFREFYSSFPRNFNFHYILFHDRSEHAFWTGGFYQGLAYWNTRSKAEIITTDNGLSNNLVRSVIQDDLNRLWFGTQNGISVLKNKFITVFNKNSGLKDEFIWGIKKIDNNVFVCTNAGIYTLSRKGGKFSLTSPTFSRAMSDVSFNYICRTSQGIFLTTAQRFGLYQFSENQLVSLSHHLEKADCRLAIYLYEDSENRIWIGGYDIGYWKDNRYHHLKTLPFSSDLKNRNIVYDIVQSPETGTVYFAATDGLYSYDGKQVTYHPAPYQFDAIYSQIEYDPKTRTILIGSEGKGLLHYDEKSRIFRDSRYNSLILGKNVYNIAWMDSLLLITTNQGLNAIPPSMNKCWHINTSNGLLSNETNTFGLEFDNEYIYLGTTGGLHIIPRDLNLFVEIPSGQVYIRGITSNGKKMDWKGKNRLFLPSSVKNCKISVGYTSFFDYHTPRLQYTFYPYLKLPVTSDSWEIEFYNLPYGTNTLELYAVDNEQKIISAETIKLEIYHPYPFYYRWYFYVSLGFIILLMAKLWVTLRTLRLQKLSEKLKREIQKQYEEIGYLNELLERIIQKSFFGLLLFNEQGSVIKSNQIAEKFLYSFEGYQSKIQKSDFLQLLQKKVVGGLQSDFHEIILSPDGKRRWQLVRNALRHGKFIYEMYLMHDITDILDRESYQQKMRAYQQMIATLSHYINNTLSSLQMKADMLQEKAGNNEELRELIQFSSYSIKKITFILQSLDNVVQREKVKTSDYATEKDLLIDIEHYITEFEKIHRRS